MFVQQGFNIGHISIRNYMSKPWFLKIATEAEPSALAGVIAQALKPRQESAESSGSEREEPITPQVDFVPLQDPTKGAQLAEKVRDKMTGSLRP